MNRYEPVVRDSRLYLESDGESLEVGPVDGIIDAVGGAEYTIEYDDRQQTVPWLDTEDGTLEIDVEDSITSMSHTEAFVSELRGPEMDTDKYGLPERTVAFANRIVELWEREGKE